MSKINFSIAALLISLCAQSSIDTEQSILDMTVTSDGIYRVTHDDIANLGIDLTGINLNKIALKQNGIQIPAKIISDDQTVFGINSYIEFVGLTTDSLYQKGSVYQLLLTGNTNIDQSTLLPQENLQTVEYYLQKDVYGENNAYSFGSPIDDPWFAKRILAIGTEVIEPLDFEIDNLVQAGNVEVKMNIWGGTDYLQSPDHHVIYTLNGSIIDDFRFDGIISDIRQYSLNTSLFTSGVQQITVSVPNDTNTVADVIHIESWEITYPRAFVLNQNQLDFNTNNSTRQKLLNGSDIIYQNSFEPAVQHFDVSNANNENYTIYKLKDNGQVFSYNSLQSSNCNSNVSLACVLSFSIDNSQGRVFIAAESELKSPLLKLPVILDEIKQGVSDYLIITHPDFKGQQLNKFVEAKQQNYTVKVVDIEQIYAQYGYANVSAASIASYIKFAGENLGVKNVLLIGGDTYDYKNHLGLDSVSYIPTIYGQTDDLITFAPIDAKYADIDGDNIPDINIGRFPVRTEAEFANLSEKIFAYSNKTYNKTAIFAADEFDTSNAYSFKDDAELLISQLPIQWQNNISSLNKAYVDDDGVAVAKSKITDNINQGVALTSFIGHSGPKDWSFSRMFSASDADLLINSSSPTLVTQWGCWNTYFVSPTEDTLAHAFMLNQNGGAASVLGASTLTQAEHEKGLAQLVLTFLTHDEMTLGDAVTQAKRAYSVTNPDALDVILGWNILGDPSLRL